MGDARVALWHVSKFVEHIAEMYKDRLVRVIMQFTLLPRLGTVVMRYLGSSV